jgi:hypothetical protein
MTKKSTILVARILANQGISVEAHRTVYRAVVDSRELWGSEIWNADACTIAPIECARMIDLHMFVGAKPCTSKEFFLQELAMEPALFLCPK